MNTVTKITAVVCLLALTSCGLMRPRNPEWWMEKEKNACLPTAISFREALGKRVKWSHVLIYKYLDTKQNKYYGHAVCAYMYPVGKNQLWVYDYRGSVRVRAYIDQPLEVAKGVEKAAGNDHYEIIQAEYLTE
jgi:hypothetical protein